MGAWGVGDLDSHTPTLPYPHTPYPRTSPVLLRSDETGCVTQHYIASAHATRSWRPSTGQPALKQLVGIGRVIQESNRSHDTESGCIKQEKNGGFKFQHYIVRELILGDDGKEIGGRLAPEGPLQDLLEIV